LRDDVTVGEVVEGVVVERRGRWGVAVKGVGEAFVGVLVATAFGAVQHRVAGDDDLPFADGAGEGTALLARPGSTAGTAKWAAYQ